jgi:hypothetical protein
MIGFGLMHREQPNLVGEVGNPPADVLFDVFTPAVR